ncbi:MAG: phosphatase PAP2 family protein [Tatlockia sp.]|nr:phosphatase PAP2 family protein [Tatlockia sp.]
MIDYLAKGFLYFDNAGFIFPLMIIGFIWFDRKMFYHAISLILLCILVNIALKISFQVPLSPSLHQVGFAFPSGHMQLATTLYLWFALQVKNKWFRAAILILLSGIGWGTIYFGYHDVFDIMGAVLFALLLLFFYCYVDLKWPEKLPCMLLILATLLLIYINIRMPMANVWKGFYGLWGLIIAEQIANRKKAANCRSHKLLATFLFIFGAALIFLFFRNMPGFEQAAYIFQIKWLLIGLLLPSVNGWATGLLNHLSRQKV